MKISTSQFKGMAPKLDPIVLPKDYAQNSVNVAYGSGTLVPIKDALAEVELDSTLTYKTIHKYNTSPTAYEWLSWTTEVDLARDPVYSDTYNRTCITGLYDAPRIFDSSLLGSYTTVSTANSYLLGLAIPATPTIALSGSSTAGTPETRAYVIAYSRKWTDGKIDDGPWSAPAETSGGVAYVDVPPADSVVVSNIPDAPAGYGITEINVYRSVAGTTTGQFQLVISFNITSAKAGSVTGVTWNSGTSKFTFLDNIATTDLGAVGNNQLWIAPPTSLTKITSLQNGILAGVSENFVYFSEPYQVHAWPDKYRVAIDRPVVGLGAFGNTLVVCTTAEPYLITLTDPASAVAYPVKESAPCVSGRAIVSFRDAVVYPSYSGFYRIDSAGIVNMTQAIADARDIAAYNVATMVSAGLDTMYYGVYLDTNGQRKIFSIDMAHPDYGLAICDAECTAIVADPVQSVLYVVRKYSSNYQAIAKYDRSDVSLRLTWRSKKFSSQDDSINFSCARVRHKQSTAEPVVYDYTDIELLEAIAARDFNEYPINGLPGLGAELNTDVIFKYYVDGVLVFTKLVNNSLPFRLPAGIVGHYFEIEIASCCDVYEIDLATSMKELFTEDPYTLEMLK